MVDSAVRKRLALGASGNVYESAVAALVQLASVPILLHAWGTNLYGEWLVLFAIPAYLSLANLGYSLSIANDMTTRVAAGDRTGAIVAYQSLTALVSVTTALALAVLVPLIFFLPLSDLLHNTVIGTADARWVILFLASEVLAQLLGGVSSAGYRATGQYGLGVALATTVRLLEYAVLWGVASAGLGVALAAGAFAATRLAGTSAMTIYLSRRCPWLQLGLNRASWKYVRGLLRPSVANLLLPFANALRIQGLVLLVGALLGPAAVVVLSVLRTLTRLPVRGIAAVSHAVEPEVAVAEGAQDRALQQSLFAGGMRAALWAGILCGIGLFLAGNTILNLWTGGRVPMDQRLFLWLLGDAVLAVFWHFSLAMLQALNRHQRASLAYLLGAGLIIGLTWVFLRLTGDLADVGMSMLIGDLLLALFILPQASQQLGVRTKAIVSFAANPLPLARTALQLPYKGSTKLLTAWLAPGRDPR